MFFSTLDAQGESTSRAPTFFVLSTNKVRHKRVDSVFLHDVDWILIQEEARRPPSAEHKSILYFAHPAQRREGGCVVNLERYQLFL